MESEALPVTAGPADPSGGPSVSLETSPGALATPSPKGRGIIMYNQCLVGPFFSVTQHWLILFLEGLLAPDFTPENVNRHRSAPQLKL